MFRYFFYVCASEIEGAYNLKIIWERSYLCVFEIEGASNFEIIGE